MKTETVLSFARRKRRFGPTELVAETLVTAFAV